MYDRSRPTLDAKASWVKTYRLDQLLVSLRLLDRIEILALDIFNQSDLEKALIRHLLNDDWHSRQSREFRGAPTSLSGNQLESAVATSHE